MVQEIEDNFLNYNFIILLLISFECSNFILKIYGFKCLKSKIKCRSYLVEYNKLGFVPFLLNTQLPICYFCDKTFTKQTMKPFRLKNYLSRIHFNILNKPIKFLQALKESHNSSSLSNVFANKADQNVK